MLTGGTGRGRPALYRGWGASKVLDWHGFPGDGSGLCLGANLPRSRWVGCSLSAAACTLGCSPMPFPLTNSISNTHLSHPLRMVSRVQYSFMTPGANGADSGAFVTIVYSAECLASQKKSRPATLLPLLVILFIVSYGILTLLVFEQGRTIESQRTLIRAMLQDSTQLASLKGKLARDESNRPHDMAAAQAEHKDADSGNRSTGNPAAGSRSTGNPAAGAKGSDKQTKRPSKSARSTKEAPGKPASDLTDVRRSTRVI